MIVELLILIAGILFLIQYFHYRTKPPGTPPGNIGLPLLGTLPPKDISYEEHMNRCRKKYGDIFWTRMGSMNMVYLCKYEDIVAAFNNPAMQGRPDFYSGNLLSRGSKTKGIIFSQGTPWKNLRRFAIRRLRDGGMGKSSMESIIMYEAEALVENFKKHIGHNTEFPWSINGSVLNVIWKLVADKRYEVDDLDTRRLYRNIQEVILHMQGPGFMILEVIPFLGKYAPNFVLNLFGKKVFEEKVDKLFTLAEDAIHEHRETLDEDNPRDLIDSYIIELNKMAREDTGNQSENYNTFCENELIFTILDLFIAGSETTSSTIRWYLLLMAKYPEIQSKVHKELDKVLSGSRRICLEDRESLPFFEATINETLRLRPILPTALLHVASEDTIINEYIIPKGTHISANLQACHKNGDCWKNPNDFYPEHFLNEDGTFNAKKEGLLSFSTGRRVCLGESLARMDLYFVLATLMMEFSFLAPEGETISAEAFPDTPFFLLPQPCNVIISKR